MSTLDRLRESCPRRSTGPTSTLLRAARADTRHFDPNPIPEAGSRVHASGPIRRTVPRLALAQEPDVNPPRPSLRTVRPAGGPPHHQGPLGGSTLPGRAYLPTRPLRPSSQAPVRHPLPVTSTAHAPRGPVRGRARPGGTPGRHSPRGTAPPPPAFALHSRLALLPATRDRAARRSPGPPRRGRPRPRLSARSPGPRMEGPRAPTAAVAGKMGCGWGGSRPTVAADCSDACPAPEG